MTRAKKNLLSIFAAFIALFFPAKTEVFSGGGISFTLALIFGSPFISLVFDEIGDTSMKNRILNVAILSNLMAMNFDREHDAFCKNTSYLRIDRIDVNFLSPDFPHDVKPQHLSQIKNCMDALLSMIYSDKVSPQMFYRLRVSRASPSTQPDDALRERARLAFLQLYEPGTAVHTALSLTEAD